MLASNFTCCLTSAEQGVAPEAVAEAYHAYEQGSPVSPLQAAAVSNQTIQESQRLLLLVRAYQARFHLLAFFIFLLLRHDCGLHCMRAWTARPPCHSLGTFVVLLSGT